jgi:hypothetical protein
VGFRDCLECAQGDGQSGTRTPAVMVIDRYLGSWCGSWRGGRHDDPLAQPPETCTPVLVIDQEEVLVVCGGTERSVLEVE